MRTIGDVIFSCFLTALVVSAPKKSATSLQTSWPDHAYDIGWSQLACVTTTDEISGSPNGQTVEFQTRHCLSGQELAKWMQEHHR